ncbi:MAG TPA: FHA domain-containing protein [Luteimonas sp.]|nr:FHA domain-containing protein [Luteimonas sp.]
MDTLKLRFSNQDVAELPLAVGVHGVGRMPGQRDQLVPVTEGAAVHFHVDRRGVWLTVAEGTRGVHVNGREIQRMAMLRVGDAIFVDGIEMRLLSGHGPQALPSDWRAEDGADPGDVRVVLRGVGGQYHGRSFTLERPRLVGRSADADIRIDEASFADRHARIEIRGQQVALRDLGTSEGSLVNGEQVRDVLLLPGDQVVFDGHHRFVLEAPARAAAWRDASTRDGVAAAFAERLPSPPASALRWPWLLLAALGLALVLGSLLLFGAG